jgi:hypothetical protein
MSRFKSGTIFITVAVATLVVVHLAKAQSVKDWRKATETEQPQFKLIQSYNGTTPGTGNSLPKVEELKEMDGSWITWPGFTMKSDGGSRIFLQTNTPLEYSQKNKKKKITITFKKTKIFLSNNQNPLITQHFNTPLGRAYLKKHRKDAQLVLLLKQDTEVQIQQVAIEDGYNYVFIDFAAGQYNTNSDSPRPSFSGGGDAPDAPEGQISDKESPF